MKRIALYAVVLAAAGPCRNSDQYAHAGERSHVVVSSFAVPVAVPVSPYAAYAYSSSQAQVQAYSAPPRSAEDVLADHLAAKIADRLGLQLQPAKAAAPASLFSRTCAKCHAQANADLGKPQLIEAELTTDQRLKAIRQLATGQMPKGGKISDQVRGDLITELSSVPTIANEPKAEAPPPPPTDSNQ